MYSMQITLLENVLSVINENALLLHDNEILFVNKKAEAFLSVASAEIAGKNFREVFYNNQNKNSKEKKIGNKEFFYFPDKFGVKFYTEVFDIKLTEEEEYVLVKLFHADKLSINKFTLLDQPRELPVALLVTDSDGLLLYADDQFLQFTSFSAEDIHEKYISDIFPLDSVYLYNYLKGNRNNSGSEIVRLRYKNNEERFLHANILHLSPDTDKYYWLFSDPVDSLEIAKELQQKEQYISSIFRAAPVGIGVIYKNCIIYANQLLSEVTGYELSELIGNSLERLFKNKADYEKISDLSGSDQIANLVSESEVEWKTKEGKLKTVKFNITENGNLTDELSFTFSVADISESKIAREKLKISENRYRKLIQEAADAIIIVQINKGLIIEVNQKTCLLTRYTKEELLGSHISMILPRDLNHEYIDLFISEEWTRSHPITKTEILTKNNQLIPVEINNYLLDDENGKIIIGFYRDLSDRKHWEIKLTESERRYKALFDSVKEGIIITNISNNIILLANQTISDWFGYSIDELCGKTLDFLFFSDNFSADKLSNLIKLKETYLQNVLCTAKNQRALYFDIRSSSILIDGKNHTVLYLTNVTERYEQQLSLERINQELILQDKKYKKLNQELQKSYSDLSTLNKELEKKSTEYQQLFNEMVNGFAVHEMIYDKDGKPFDYRYLSVNPAFEKLTGLQAERVIGRTVREILPNIENYWIEMYGHVAKTGIPVSSQNYADELGKYFETVAYSPAKDIFAVVFNDITQRETNRIELNKIFNLSIDFICIASFDGYFLKVNPTFQTILGYTEEELLTKKVNDFIFESDQAITRKVIFQEITKGSAVNNFQNRLVAKDGRIIWVSWTAQPLINGKTIFAIGHNITDQKKSENELIVAKEKAIESDRLKSAFLANMSHEVRTPMNAIIGFSSLLDTDELEHEKRKKYTQIIRSRCDDLLRIIDDILDISRIEAGQVVISANNFTLNGLMLEVYEIHKQRLINLDKSKLEFVLNPATEEISLFNDRQRVLQVLNNLIDNAIKFTNEGKIEIGYSEYLPDKVLLYVSDTGIGIPKEKHQVIFQRFRQAEENLTRKFGGNGLGLAISKPLIQLMGGNIWLESEPGKGTTFYFTLDKFLGQPELTNLIKLQNKRILVVEDDRHSVDYFRILLEQLGAVITHARSGNECLSLLHSGIKFDIILMDIQLTDISGIEVTRLIRKFDVETPIIAETAYARAEDRKHCLYAGCNDFIAKPVDDENLVRTILKYLE